ncbi:MAG: uracil-DNA glycosylase [Actinomycetota bacterium]|nr:uracil-DNA glycosylase [Actinomycetota bacterium]
MANLTALVRKIATARNADVPWFDPASGGSHSRVLCLVESPGPKSARTSSGSGIISVDNDDQTAANSFRAMEEAGLQRNSAMNWNVVPWYLDTVRRPTSAEIRSAVPWLVELLALLNDLRVVVLLGAAARESWTLIQQQRQVNLSTIKLLMAPHPSPQSINRDRTQRWPQLVGALREAASVAALP